MCICFLCVEAKQCMHQLTKCSTHTVKTAGTYVIRCVQKSNEKFRYSYDKILTKFFNSIHWSADFHYYLPGLLRVHLRAGSELLLSRLSARLTAHSQHIQSTLTYVLVDELIMVTTQLKRTQRSITIRCSISLAIGDEPKAVIPSPEFLKKCWDIHTF